MKKYRRFYKLYGWILEEMGASTDAALISIIYSFSEMKQECELSYTDFADILKVQRKNAVLRIKNLIKAGYIKVSKDKKTNVYSVCVEKFKYYSPENVPTDSPENVPTDSPENVPTDSPENVPTDSPENVPTYYNRELKENIKRERENARTQNAEPFISIQNHENIKLTQAGYDRLQREVHGTGKTVECYLRALDYQMKSTGKSLEPHLEKLLLWIQIDKDKAKQNSKAKPEAAEDSSIDMQLLEEIMYGDFGAAEDPAQDARTAPQSRRPADGPTLPRS